MNPRTTPTTSLLPAEGLLTAERERNLRREHERLHPDALMRSGKACDICLLLAALKETHRRIPRCTANTARGYRCAQGQGHRGSHSHPNDDRNTGEPVHAAAFFENGDTS